MLDILHCWFLSSNIFQLCSFGKMDILEINVVSYAQWGLGCSLGGHGSVLGVFAYRHRTDHAPVGVMCKWSYCGPQASVVKQRQQTWSNRYGLKLVRPIWLTQELFPDSKSKVFILTSFMKSFHFVLFQGFPIRLSVLSTFLVTCQDSARKKHVESGLRRGKWRHKDVAKEEQGGWPGQLVRHPRLWWKTWQRSRDKIWQNDMLNVGLITE